MSYIVSAPSPKIWVIKKNEMSEACGTYDREERWLQF